MTSDIRTFHFNGKDYEFTHPVKVGDSVMPLLAVIETIQTRTSDDQNKILNNIDAYLQIVVNKYKPRLPVNKLEVRDLYLIYKHFNTYSKIAIAYSRYVDQLMPDIYKVLNSNPNIDFYDFVRKINTIINTKLCTDDVVRCTGIGTYYVDDSWKNVTNEYIDGLLTWLRENTNIEYLATAPITTTIPVSAPNAPYPESS